MFNRLQKFLLDKAFHSDDDKSPSKKRNAKTKNKKQAARKGKQSAPQAAQDFRTPSAVALDDAIQKLENSGQKMDDMLSEHESLLAQVKAEAAKKMTPERRALLDQAQRIRATQEKILEDLDDESRARLYLTALRAFTGRQ